MSEHNSSNTSNSNSKLTRAQFFRKIWHDITSFLLELFEDQLDVIDKAFPELIRPPGAVSETHFLELCTRCGACWKACPYFAIKPVARPNSFDEGTPHIQPTESWCRMCVDLPCARACPTGALKAPSNRDLSQNNPNHHNQQNKQPWDLLPHQQEPNQLESNAEATLPIRIGLAEVSPKHCLRSRGISCTACLTACPTRFHAIVISGPNIPPKIDTTRCCGCGACCAACPAAPTKAIRIMASPHR